MFQTFPKVNINPVVFGDGFRAIYEGTASFQGRNKGETVFPKIGDTVEAGNVLYIYKGEGKQWKKGLQFLRYIYFESAPVSAPDDASFWQGPGELPSTNQQVVDAVQAGSELNKKELHALNRVEAQKHIDSLALVAPITAAAVKMVLANAVQLSLF